MFKQFWDGQTGNKWIWTKKSPPDYVLLILQWNERKKWKRGIWGCEEASRDHFSQISVCIQSLSSLSAESLVSRAAQPSFALSPFLHPSHPFKLHFSYVCFVFLVIFFLVTNEWPRISGKCWGENQQGENIRFSLIHHLKNNIQQLVSAGKSQETDNVTKTSQTHDEVHRVSFSSCYLKSRDK